MPTDARARSSGLLADAIPIAYALTVCALTTTGCVSAGDGSPGVTGHVAEGVASTVPTHPTMSQNLDMQSRIDAAIADAAARSGMDRASIKLLSAEAVTWSDGSLGCPRPGLSYTQALVPGYRIRLQAGAATFDYHASRRGALQLCPPGQAVEPIRGSGPT